MMPRGRLAIVALGIAVVALDAATPAPAAVLEPGQRKAVEATFKAIKADKWTAARRRAKGVTDPVAAKLIDWFDLTRPGTKASFADIDAFRNENPHWPGQRDLRRRAEEAMTAGLPAADVLAWFADREPLTGDGWERLAGAAVAAGDRERARRVVRRAWVAGNFGKRQERRFYKRFRRHLTRDDHVARLDRLAWEGRYWPARRMLWKVKEPVRALGLARIMLRRMEGNVDRAIAAVPESLRDHPGLVYERLRWRRRKGKDLSARELLADPPDDLVRPRLWWDERAILARRALADGHVSEAYRLAAEHGLDSGPDHAEAEWLAGWIALTFLDEPRRAGEHFATMFDRVRTPVSRARAAYWAGRANETTGDDDQARPWYARAAVHVTTYYGQLAARRLHPPVRLHLPPPPLVDAAEKAAFEGHELVRAIRILATVGAEDRLRPFVLRLAEARDSLSWQALTAALARTARRPDLAIHIARQARRNGGGLIRSGYPVSPMVTLTGGGTEADEGPLLLAMIRQESGFYASAVSPAGARGLLQLMPRTARKTAQRLRLPYSSRRLLSDPAYNLTLGRAYLDDLKATFAGSDALALAAYNAGPARVKRWIRTFGDPRDAAVDTIDWIESIPFEETRNYVQRVIEGRQVYRLRLTEPEMAMTLEAELHP